MRELPKHLRIVALWAGVFLGGLGVLPLRAQMVWIGAGGNNNVSTAANWSGGTPTRGGNSNLTFAGSTRLAPAFDSGGWSVNSLTFASGAGAFTLAGGELTMGSGGLTNNSANTQTINNQIKLAANQTWNAASGAIVSTAYIDANSKALTLSGSSAITVSGYLNNVGTLNLSGSGNRTFNSSVSSATTNIASTGINTFNAQINVGTLNISAGTSNIANAQVSAGTYVSGASNVNFTGPVTGGGGITLDTSGNVTFSGNINSGSLTLNGSGTTTITGSGNMSTGAVTVNNGTLVMDHTGSAAINSSLTVNSGGTVTMTANNQVPTWQTVTLNEGSTLNLNDTTQAIQNLIITGDTTIDFGSGGSQLNVASYGSINITNDVTITILNWDSSTDVFSGQQPANNTVVQVQYVDSGGTVYAAGTWGGGGGNGGFITPGAPVPEPSTYGLIFVGSALGFVGWRRWRASRRRARCAPAA